MVICEMMLLTNKRIFRFRDQLSQEITIHETRTMKDKTSLPHYLKYSDGGYVFPGFVTFCGPLIKLSE